MNENVSLTDVQTQGQSQGTAFNQENLATQSETQTRTFSQSEVDDLIGRVRKEARETGRRDALVEKANVAYSNQQPTASNYQPPVNSESNYNSPAFNPSQDQIRQMIAEETAQMQQNAALYGVVSDFAGKINVAKANNQDYSQTVEPLIEEISKNPDKLGNLVFLANSTDNTADVMYELARNPTKIGNLLTLAEKSSTLAQMEMQKLSQSIKENKNAKAIPKVNEPLSQMTPSNVGTGNGSMSMDDLRALDFLRG